MKYHFAANHIVIFISYIFQRYCVRGSRLNVKDTFCGFIGAEKLWSFVSAVNIKCSYRYAAFFIAVVKSENIASVQLLRRRGFRRGCRAS